MSSLDLTPVSIGALSASAVTPGSATARGPSEVGDVPVWDGNGWDYPTVFDADGTMTLGSGDALTILGITSTAQDLQVRRGTSASPDSNLHPVVKVERTIEVEAAAVSGDGAEQLSAISGMASSTVDGETQPIGVYGAAKSSSTYAGGGGGRADACGLYGYGLVDGSGVGYAIGGFFGARIGSADGNGIAVEAAVRNESGADHTYGGTGAGDSMGLWVHATGTYKSDAGIVLGVGSGNIFRTGLCFTSENPCDEKSIWDKGNAAYSVLIEGTHATAAVAIGSGSGALVIGRTTQATSTTVLEVTVPTGSTNPAVWFRGAATTDSFTTRFGNGSGSSDYFVSGTAGGFLTSTVAGDTGVKINTAAKAWHVGGTTKVVSVAQDNKLGFFAATPVARQAFIADPSGGATTDAEARTAINSILDVLVAYGLMAAS